MHKTKVDENSLSLSLQVAIMRKNTKITWLCIILTQKNTKVTRFSRFLGIFCACANGWTRRSFHHLWTLGTRLFFLLIAKYFAGLLLAPNSTLPEIWSCRADRRTLNSSTALGTVTLLLQLWWQGQVVDCYMTCKKMVYHEKTKLMLTKILCMFY